MADGIGCCQTGCQLRLLSIYRRPWLSPQDLPFHWRSCTLVYLLMGLFSISTGGQLVLSLPWSVFHPREQVTWARLQGSNDLHKDESTFSRDVFHDCLLMSSFSCFCQRHGVCTWNLLGDFSTHRLFINRLPLWPASFLCWVPCWLIKLHAT